LESSSPSGQIVELATKAQRGSAISHRNDGVQARITVQVGGSQHAPSCLCSVTPPNFESETGGETGHGIEMYGFEE
jgi:hypothetical protein